MKSTKIALELFGLGKKENIDDEVFGTLVWSSKEKFWYGSIDSKPFVKKQIHPLQCDVIFFDPPSDNKRKSFLHLKKIFISTFLNDFHNSIVRYITQSEPHKMNVNTLKLLKKEMEEEGPAGLISPVEKNGNIWIFAYSLPSIDYLIYFYILNFKLVKIGIYNR